MTTAYTNLLGLALPVDGELTGAWGSTINNSITSLIEDAVANFATHDITAGNWTLTTTGSGTSNEARMAILIVTGTPGVTRSIIAPGHSKMYMISNQSNASIMVKSASTTGVTIAAGQNTTVAWNNVDFVEIKSTQVLNIAGGSAGTIPYQTGSGVTAMLAAGTSGYLLQSNGVGAPSWVAAGTGGITSVNTGTSSNINGILKGNGSTLSAASAGTDYVIPTATTFGSTTMLTLGSSLRLYSDPSSLTTIQCAAAYVSTQYNGSTAYIGATTTGAYKIWFGNGNDCDLGSSALPVKTIYTQNAVVVVSDKREKTEVTQALGLEFIKALKPVNYTWKIGGYDTSHITDRRTPEELLAERVPIIGTRVHAGFFAQDVKEVLDAQGVDFGGWVIEDKNDPESKQMLRYEEFISPIVKAIQEQQAMIESLQARLVALGG